MSGETLKLDQRTDEWFKKHPEAVTTLMQCRKCERYYKPSLGHKCIAKEIKINHESN